MATTTQQTTDVAAVLHGLIETVQDVRVYSYVADIARPPAAVIGQPALDFTDASSGFCRATWMFPVTLITTRSNDRAAQAAMSQLLLDVVASLKGDVPDWVLGIEAVDARPLAGVAVNGQEMPAYQLNIRVKA